MYWLNSTPSRVRLYPPSLPCAASARGVSGASGAGGERRSATWRGRLLTLLRAGERPMPASQAGGSTRACRQQAGAGRRPPPSPPAHLCVLVHQAPRGAGLPHHLLLRGRQREGRGQGAGRVRRRAAPARGVRAGRRARRAAGRLARAPLSAHPPRGTWAATGRCPPTHQHDADVVGDDGEDAVQVHAVLGQGRAGQGGTGRGRVEGTRGARRDGRCGAAAAARPPGAGVPWARALAP